MSKFMKYFLMEAKDVIAYVKEKLSKFEHAKGLQCKEIGDGNLNYVFAFGMKKRTCLSS